MLAIAPLLLAGCVPPDSVASKSRKPSQSPKFYTEQDTPSGGLTLATSVDGIDLSFLKSDHFGCFLIHVSQLVKQPLLSELPWSQINEAMSPMIGSANSDLHNIDRIWVILDSEFVQFPPGLLETPSPPPWVIILDFNKPIDRSQLEAANARRSTRGENLATENESETKFPEIESVAMTDQRIAIGDASALAKLSGDQRLGTDLVVESQKIPKDADVWGAITTRPLRPILRSVFDMLAGFSPEAKQYAALPADLKKMTLAINLSDRDDFFELAIFLDNPELRAEIIKIGNAAISSGMSPTSSVRPGLSVDDLLPTNTGQKSMVIQSAPEALKKVGAEIQNDQSPRLETVDESIVIQIGRPASLPNLMGAVIQDAQQEIQLTQRIEKMEKIGAALKKYEGQYGALPSVQARVASSNLPGQLSWRVAILPMLGYQDLYDRFDFDLPWNHADNLAVAIDIPIEFQSIFPGGTANSPPRSNVHLFAGEGGLHADQKTSPKIDAIKDRKIWTAIAIE